MKTIYNLNKFDKQMKRFKKHTKVVKAFEPEEAYFMRDSDKMFDFLDYSEYDPMILGKSAEFFQNVIIKNFFIPNTPHAIYYEEAWKTDEDNEFYIKMKDVKNDGDTGVFEVWNYYDVALIEVTLIQDPFGNTPKLIKVKSLEHLTHYAFDDEDEEDIA